MNSSKDAQRNGETASSVDLQQRQDAATFALRTLQARYQKYLDQIAARTRSN